MTGLIAVYAFDDVWNVGRFVYYGLLSLNHRGQDKYIIHVLGKDGIETLYVNELDDDALNRISSQRPWAAIAGAFPPFVDVEKAVYLANDNGANVAVIMDRGPNAITAEELGNKIHDYLRQGISLDKALSKILLSSDSDIWSLLVLSSNGELIVYRGSKGLRPLAIGGYGFDMVFVSTETSSINILGGEPRKSMNPGEALYVSRYLVKFFRIHESSKSKLCIFELLYLSRPDSDIDGINVYEFRKRLGEELAKVFRGKIDLVVPVPETATPYAIGFAQALNKRFEMGFVSTGSKVRSALRLDPLERLIAIQLKMNPIKNVLSGKSVALIDDSIVTGLTMKTLAQILRNRIGVRELHIVIASPKLVNECPFNILPYKRQELLASNVNEEDFVKVLEADSVTWLDLNILRNVSQEFNINPCINCLLEVIR